MNIKIGILNVPKHYSKHDLIHFVTTFLDENTDDNILQIDGFHFECKDRTALRQGALNTKRGGGVIVYIADLIKYKRRNDPRSSEIETIWLEINLKNTKPFLISSVYRPPSSHVQWINEFSLQIEKAASAADEMHFLEDFNINLLSDETHSRTWSHSLEAFDFS